MSPEVHTQAEFSQWISLMPHAIALSQVLQAASLAQKVTNLLGLVEFIDTKLDRLLHADLGAGMRHLMSARDSSSDTEQLSQLRDARACFQKAVVIEETYKKAVSLLGLACCQYWLGETTNGNKALVEILVMDPVSIEFIAKGAAARTWHPLHILSYMTLTLINHQETVDLILEAEDVKNMYDIQKIVSKHFNQPISWLRGCKPRWIDE